MSQLFRTLIARSVLAKRAIASSARVLDSQPTYLRHFFQTRGSLLVQAPASLSTPRFYVTNSDPTKSTTKFRSNRDFEAETSREFDDFDTEHQQPSPRRRFDGYSQSRFQDRGRDRRDDRPPRQERVQDTEIFEGAEPIESSGKVSNYTGSAIDGFGKYNLPEKLLERLKVLGYDKPFEIQEATLAHSLAGKDLVGKAFTGSGKTLAFAIPIIAKIYNSPNKTSKHPKCLVLSPTRELCLQLQKTIQELAPDLKCLAIYGGANYSSQVIPLSRKVDIVCATPGRLRDLMNRNTFIPDDIEIICLDEADELLNPNFIEQISEVIQRSSEKKQMMMFSATINKNVYGLINEYMKDPIYVDLTKGQKYKLPTNIEHCVVRAKQEDGTRLVSHYVKEYQSDRCIVFTVSKRDAISINYTLRKEGFRSSDLHSDISQTKRQHIFEDFRRGRLQILVATDVAARGIDVPETSLVIQVGFPMNGMDYYIHRSGRTGRAGRVGTSILIDDGTKKSELDKLSRLIKFKTLDLPEGYEAVEEQESFDEGKYMNKKYKRFNSNRNFGEYNNKYNRYNNSREPFEKYQPRFQSSKRFTERDHEEQF